MLYLFMFLSSYLLSLSSYFIRSLSFRAWHFMVSTTTRIAEVMKGLPPLFPHSLLTFSVLEKLCKICNRQSFQSKYQRKYATYAVESIGKDQADRSVLGLRTWCTVLVWGWDHYRKSLSKRLPSLPSRYESKSVCAVFAIMAASSVAAESIGK